LLGLSHLENLFFIGSAAHCALPDIDYVPRQDAICVHAIFTVLNSTFFGALQQDLLQCTKYYKAMK
ncbi:MAG: hypothetical protein WBD71_17705, partial [Xanthobacteraceae bacterium]